MAKVGAEEVDGVGNFTTGPLKLSRVPKVDGPAPCLNPINISTIICAAMPESRAEHYVFTRGEFFRCLVTKIESLTQQVQGTATQ